MTSETLSVLSRRSILSALALVLIPASAAWAAQAPVVDSFSASTSTPVPGQVVAIALDAHDPDCATTCSSGCGTTIRADLFRFDDDSGRGPASFTDVSTTPTSSPFRATASWTAPPADGVYTITAQLSDSGSFMCGGRQTTVATLTITVSSIPIPVIDSFTVTPEAVAAGGSASLAVNAHDPESRPLTYEFFADAGTIDHGSPSSSRATWTAPSVAGTVTVGCRVRTDGAPAVTGTREIEVRIGNYQGNLPLESAGATRIEILDDGTFVIVGGNRGTLARVTRTGSILWTRSGLQSPSAVALLDNVVYVLERRVPKISRWSLDGSPMGSFALSAATPNDIASHSSRKELVVTDTAAGSVTVIDAATGAHKLTFGQGILLNPSAVAHTGTAIGVADPGRRRVFVFDTGGNLTATLGDDTLFVRPQSVSWEPQDETWIITDAFSGEIHVLGSDGTARGVLGGFGTGAQALVTPIDTSRPSRAREFAVATQGQGVHLYQLVTSLPAPAPATNVVASDLPGDDGNALVVTWTLSPDDPQRITTYHLERDRNADAQFTRIAAVPSGTNRFVDDTAQPGVCHAYVVVASDGVVEAPSMPSRCSTAINDLAPPSPAPAVAVPVDPFSIRVDWRRVSVADLGGYLIDLTWPGGSRSLSVASALSSAIVDGLPSGQDILVSVRAFDSANNLSAPASASARTWPDVAPGSPAAVVATDLGRGGVVDLSWQPFDSPVPIANYLVTFRPQVAGWPTKTLSLSEGGGTASQLVNQLGYVASVTPVTPWGREGTAVESNLVVPTGQPSTIPVLGHAGRVGSSNLIDSAGVVVNVPFGEKERKLRFAYRTLGTEIDVTWNGQALETLPDTLGEWLEHDLDLRSRESGEQQLAFINHSFPAFEAEAAVQLVDLVPLPPRHAGFKAFDTVIDLSWEWAENREDLSIAVDRADRKSKPRPVRLGEPTATWTRIDCKVPSTGVCRDTFLETGEQWTYALRTLSPAGWSSAPEYVNAGTHPPRVVTPVTDLSVSSVDGTAVLDWTPVSFRSNKTGETLPVPYYRIYTTDGLTLRLIEMVTAPHVVLPTSTLLNGEWFVVRSVDDEWKESE